MRNLAFVMVIGVATPACWLNNNADDGPPPDLNCASPVSYTIDNGASIDHTAGVDAGYYASYSAGDWHLEWTCDTKLSAEGCNFTGTITSPASAVATCYQCETEDILTQNGGDISFNTITTTGIDGVDITVPAGSSIQVDLQINDLYQNDLVFLPSLGLTQSPSCMPITLTPSAP